MSPNIQTLKARLERYKRNLKSIELISLHTYVRDELENDLIVTEYRRALTTCRIQLRLLIEETADECRKAKKVI